MSHARRSEFTFGAVTRELTSLTTTLTGLRATFLMVVVAAVLLDGDQLWLAALAIPSAIGVYQSIVLSRSMFADVPPREPIARWGWNSAMETYGQHRVLVSGLLENLGGLLLVAMGPFLLDDPQARLLAWCGAVGYMSFCFVAIFLDGAFYTPNDDPPAWMEWVRSLVGVLLALIGVAVIAASSWPSQWVVLAYAISVLPVLVSVAVRVRDRVLMFAEAQHEAMEDQRVREIMLEGHGLISGSVNAVAAMVKDDTGVRDRLKQIQVGVHQFLALEQVDLYSTRDLRTFQKACEWLAVPFGMNATFTHDGSPVSLADQDRVRLVLFDLVVNAAKAEAKNCLVELSVADQVVTVRVHDDGAPFVLDGPPKKGSSLRRLHDVLAADGGGLVVEPGDQDAGFVKCVVASWKVEKGRGTR
jgi:heme exporter protein D